jgi:hypothetical protein
MLLLSGRHGLLGQSTWLLLQLFVLMELLQGSVTAYIRWSPPLETSPLSVLLFLHKCHFYTHMRTHPAIEGISAHHSLTLSSCPPCMVPTFPPLLSSCSFKTLIVEKQKAACSGKSGWGMFPCCMGLHQKGRRGLLQVEKLCFVTPIAFQHEVLASIPNHCFFILDPSGTRLAHE